MSAIFLLSDCLTYWPSKNTTRVDPHVDNSHQVWSWYDHTLPSYSCSSWRVTWTTLLPSLKTPYLSVLDLWVITSPVGYPWECVRGHCACAESRDPWIGAQKQLRFWNPRLWFAYSLCKFGGSTMKVIKVICENNARPCVKRRMSFCACAKSCDMLEVT